MRKLVYQALTSSLPLVAEIPIARWLQAGAADHQPVRPFAVIRIVDGPPSISKAVQPNLQIWVHDNRGSYTKIDAIIELIKAAFTAALPLEDSTSRLVDANWTGDGPDLVDDGFNTNTRFTNFTLTGRK